MNKVYNTFLYTNENGYLEFTNDYDKLTEQQQNTCNELGELLDHIICEQVCSHEHIIEYLLKNNKVQLKVLK